MIDPTGLILIEGAVAFALWMIAWYVIAFSYPDRFWVLAFVVLGIILGVLLGIVISWPLYETRILGVGIFLFGLPFMMSVTGFALYERWRIKGGKWF